MTKKEFIHVSFVDLTPFVVEVEFLVFADIHEEHSSRR